MKKPLLLLSVCLASHFLFAQDQSKIDSLKSLLVSVKEDTSRINILNMLSRQLRRKDNAAALKYAEEGEALAQKLINKATNDKQRQTIKRQLAVSELNIGAIYEFYGNYNKALHKDSLSLKIFTEIGNKKGIADAYSAIANTYYYQANYSEALKISFISLKILTDLNNKRAVVACYNNIGNIYRRQGNYTESLNYYLKGLEKSNEIGYKDASLYNNIGNAYNEQGNYPEALENYFAALKINDSTNNKNGVGLSYMNIANVYAEQKNFTDALKNYSLSESIFKELGNKKGVGAVYGNMSQVYIDQGNYAAALKMDSLSLTIRKEIDDKEGLANCYNNIAEIYDAQNKYKEALESYFAALKIQVDIKDKRGEAISLNHIGTDYYKEGQDSNAIASLNKSIALSTDIGSAEMLRENYKALSEVYKKNNDNEKALKYYTLYTEIKDSMFNETKSKQLAEMQTKYESEKKEQQIVLLQKDSALTQSQLKQKLFESLQQESEITLLNQKKEIDSLDLNEKRTQLLAQQLKARADSSQIDNLNKDKRVQAQIAQQQKQIAQQQKFFKNMFIIGFALALLIAFLFINRFRLKQKSARALEEKNKIIADTLDELKQRQQQLVQSEKMASVGVLTAGIAHEINNPINFVSSSIKPLKRNVGDLLQLINQYETTVSAKQLKEEFREVESFRKSNDINVSIAEIDELLTGIESGATRTAEVVKGLRNFSRLDEDVLKKADLNEGIESTIVLLQTKLSQQNIEVIKSLTDLPDLECYPGQLNQVFMNVITNAMDAIGRDGKIFIATSTENNHVKISIRDTGKGMSEEVKQKIFDPFFTTKDVGKGTGLGLSISYGIIEKHDGKIEVKSEVGKGTEFIITLPIQK